MKPLLKFLSITALALIFALAPISIYADLDDTNWWSNEVERLREERDRLQQQLDDAILQPRPQPDHEPNIRLLSPQSLVLIPGEPLYADIVIRNIGNSVASHTLVTAASEGAFSFRFMDNSNVVGSLHQGRDTTLRMRLEADRTAESRTYSMTLEFSYRNRDGERETTRDTISVRIDAETAEPRVMLADFSVSLPNRAGAAGATINPGDNFTISANLQNVGTGEALGVQASIRDGLDADTIFLSGAQTSPFVQTLAPDESRPVTFNFSVAERSRSGTFPLVFEVTGRDTDGETFTESFNFFVTVAQPEAGANQAQLAINSLTSPTGTINVGQSANFAMYISNNGTTTARNIRVAATATDPAALVPTAANVRSIASLAPGASQVVQFSFAPTSDARSQHHTVGFEVSYEPQEGADASSFVQYGGMNVYNPDEDDDDDEERRSRPRIIVYAYSVEPQIVLAGEEFDLEMTFLNTSSTRRVSNIKMTIHAVEHEEDAGEVFTPVGASNTIFIEGLSPRETTTHTLRMFTVPTALPRTYNLEIVFEYEDEEFYEFTERERISVNVRQIKRLEMDGVSVPAFTVPFAPIFLDFNIINSGRTPLRNVRVFVEGEGFDTINFDNHIGNLNIGANTFYDGDFAPTEPGVLTGAVVAQGEDDIGEIIQVRHEFTITVEDMQFDDDFMFDDFDGMRPGMDGEEGQGFPVIVWWIIGAVVAAGGVAVAVVGLILRKRKKNRQLFEDI